MNKNTRTLIILLGCLISMPAISQVNDWEDQHIIGTNKEEAHCTYIPYSGINQALEAIPDNSPYYLSLNGIWKFN